VTNTEDAQITPATFHEMFGSCTLVLVNSHDDTLSPTLRALQIKFTYLLTYLLTYCTEFK